MKYVQLECELMNMSQWDWYSRGHPDNVSLYVILLLKIDGFEQTDSQGFENSDNCYEQYPLEKFFIFTIYQGWYFGFKPSITKVILTCSSSVFCFKCSS